jgi:hypothetical protein
MAVRAVRLDLGNPLVGYYRSDEFPCRTRGGPWDESRDWGNAPRHTLTSEVQTHNLAPV